MDPRLKRTPRYLALKQVQQADGSELMGHDVVLV